MRIALGYILTFGWVFLVLGLTLVLKRAVNADDEVSRKIIHISVAFAWFPMYFCFGSTWHLLVPPTVFIVLNYVSYKKNLFTAMERSDESKKSPGTVYYAVSMSVMALCTILRPACMIPYGISLFCMALGDGLAPIFGSIQKGNRCIFRSHTLYGSISVFLICLIVTIIMSTIFPLPLTFGSMLILSAAACLLELVGFHGLDNLSLPLGVFLLLVLFTL